MECQKSVLVDIFPNLLIYRDPISGSNPNGGPFLSSPTVIISFFVPCMNLLSSNAGQIVGNPRQSKKGNKWVQITDLDELVRWGEN
jgi:hypothetical protein